MPARKLAAVQENGERRGRNRPSPRYGERLPGRSAGSPRPIAFRIRRGLIERLWGYDVFISYSRKDGAPYASGLAARLSGLNFACVIDQWGMSAPGVAIPKAFRRLLRSCRALIIVGTEAAGTSLNVADEVGEFAKTSGTIVPIDLDGSISRAVWWPRIVGLPIAIEPAGVSATEPSEDVLARIRNTLTFRRRDQRLRWLAIATASGVALMVAGILGLVLQSHRLATANAGAQQDLVRSRANVAEQQKLARHYSAQNLLSVAKLRVNGDPAVAARLVEAANRIEPNLDIRDAIVAAAVANPAWNRFPAFPNEPYRGQLVPSELSRSSGFAADVRVKTVALIEPIRRDLMLIKDVDTGRTIRSVPLLPDETIAKSSPYARNLLVLTRTGVDGSFVRVFSFDALASDASQIEALLDVSIRAFDCAGGDWPCVRLDADGGLFIHQFNGASIGSAKIGRFPTADRVSIHPSGDAIAIFDCDKVTWIPRSDEWTRRDAQTMTFNAYADYPYEDGPLPNLKWGPRPHQLLIGAPTAKPDEHHIPDKLTLWAVDARRGRQQQIKEWGMEFNGLAQPIFETDAGARRIAWNSKTKGEPSRLEILTLKWSEFDQESLVEVSTRSTGVLRGTTSSEMVFEFQAAAVSPNGTFVVTGGDTRGLSGTQSGRGVFESWNLDPLDEDSSLRPESSQLPILDWRHVVKIAYSQDSRRLAVLDVTGGVTVFKVRDKAAPSFNEDLRIDDDVLARLSPTTNPLDPSGTSWLTLYGTDDARIYDLTTGAESKISLESECGKILGGELVSQKLIIVASNCAAQLQDGKVVNVKRFLASATEALIGESLVSALFGDEAVFLRPSDLSQVASARLSENSFLKDVLSTSGSASSNPNWTAYFPRLDEPSSEIVLLRLTDDHVMERWSAKTTGSAPLKFARVWATPLRKSEWSSVRSIPKISLVLALLGSNEPGDKAQLFQLRAADGAVEARLELPGLSEQLFEVSAAGLLDDETIFTAFRLYPKGVRLGLWKRSGGAPQKWLKIAPDDGIDRGNVLGIQPHADDSLLFLRVHNRDGSNSEKAYSVRTGDLVWEGRDRDYLPAPPLAKTKAGWSPVNEAAIEIAAKRIRSGGGSVVDALTKITLPPEQLKDIIGATLAEEVGAQRPSSQWQSDAQ
jgi:hypothetical protein